jgi:hypothetical protein
VYGGVSLLSTEPSAVTCIVVSGRGIHLFSWLVIFYIVRSIASCLAFSFFGAVLILLCSGEWASVPV